MKDVENAQWELGAKATEDGIACNTGNKRRLQDRQARRAEPDDRDAPDQGRRGDCCSKTLAETVLPAFVKRCGARAASTTTRSSRR